MIYTKFVLLTSEGRVLIRNEAGKELEFFSIEDFNRCSGIDLTGKVEIQYEPALPHFWDSEDPTIDENDVPYAPYEQVIADIDILETRRDDHTYNRPEAEAVPLLQDDLINALSLSAAGKRDIAENNPIAGFTPDNVFTYREERVYRLEYINAKTALGLTLTQGEIDFLNQNRDLWEYMRDISSVLNQAIGIVKGYTTIAECQAFDVETTPPWPTWTPPAPI
jgi:hypothetical protein